jgi:hypothetical protein
MSIIEQIKNLDRRKKEYLYENRIQRLKEDYDDINHIESAVKKTIKVLESGVRSTVIYGEPQSGKTELMLALTCKLLDLGYETIFMVMNDNVSLEDQNFDRFAECKELDPSPLKASEVNGDPTCVIPGEKHIIFCRKNTNNLSKLIDATRKLGKRVVLDDEADFASPDNKINKPGEASKINQLVEKLIETKPSSDISQGCYIGVTATPGRLYLNNTFFNEAEEWVFVDPYPGYSGRETFFPPSRKAQKKLPYNLKILPDEGDSPKYLKEALLRFLIRNSYLAVKSIHENKKPEPYSMLIHTSGKMDDHRIEKEQIQRYINKLRKGDEAIYTKIDQLIIPTLGEDKLIGIDKIEIAAFIFDKIGNNNILTINSRKENEANSTRAAKPKAQFTFALGGNIISRGLTFNNLLSFFFARDVKSKLQQNTYIQRARMFGNRKNLDLFEMCVPESLWNKWTDCFQMHELSLASAKAKDHRWFSGKTVNASDPGAVNKKLVHVESGEMMVGDIFDLNNQILEILENNTIGTIERIQLLLDKGLVDEGVFPKAFIAIINKYDDEPETIHMVLSGGTSIRYIEPLSGHDQATISRYRGGIIASTIKGISRYENAIHLIMPIRNEYEKCRFYYKCNYNHKLAFIKK